MLIAINVGLLSRKCYLPPQYWTSSGYSIFSSDLVAFSVGMTLSTSAAILNIFLYVSTWDIICGYTPRIYLSSKHTIHTHSDYTNVNLLLTEREGQYSQVRPEQARLLSSLLYGILFLIVQCSSGGLHLKNVRPLHPSLKFRKKFNHFSICW